jgi:hypothetical protein
MKNLFICAIALLTLSACTQPAPTGDKTTSKAAPEVVFPEDFPTYIPKYPGARPMNGPGMSLQNKMTKSLKQSQTMFVTVDSREKVKQFYKAELIKAGLAENTVQSMPIMDLAVYSKPETPNQLVSVIINKMMPGDTMVQILYQNLEIEPKN